MKTGCSSWSFRKDFADRSLDLLGFVDLAAELGLDGIEPLTRDFPSVSDRFLGDLGDRLKSNNIELSALAIVNNFAHPDPAERAQQCDDMVEWMSVCRALGLDKMRTFTGRIVAETGSEQCKKWVYECYERAVPAAERAGVTLAIENHDAVMNSAEELVEMIMHFGSPALQMNPDPTNFVRRHTEKSADELELIYSSLEAVARYAVHAHIKLNEFDDAGRPTNVDVPRLLEIYRAACYDGYQSIEYFGDGDAKDAITKAVAYLRSLPEFAK